MNVATYFSGGGLSDIGTKLAGFKLVPAVEWNGNPKIGGEDAIANVYGDNLGYEHLICCPVQNVPLSILLGIKGVDLFMFSPPCIRASVANSKQGESDLDMELAQAVCRAIRLARPRAVMVENVVGYRSFKAFKLITDTLDELGYWWQADNLNSADWGVPQTRRRLILRAVRDGYLLPLQPTHREGGGNGLKPWVGWYAAIEDLLPDCPESKLADWQMKRLPEELRNLLINGIPDDYREYAATPLEPGRDETVLTSSIEKHPMRAVLVSDQRSNTGEGVGHRNGSTPSLTVDTRPPGKTRAILVEGDAAGDRPPTALPPEEPSFTIKTPSGGRAHRAILCGVNGEGQTFLKDTMEPSGSIVSDHSAASYRAILPPVRVVALTLRCLARFQSMPDWYKFPAKKSLGCVVVGNGVPCLLAQRITENLRDSLIASSK